MLPLMGASVVPPGPAGCTLAARAGEGCRHLTSHLHHAMSDFPPRRLYDRKYYRQDVTLTNSRGQKLQASHYRPCVVTSADGRLPVVVYCHCEPRMGDWTVPRLPWEAFEV